MSTRRDHQRAKERARADRIKRVDMWTARARLAGVTAEIIEQRLSWYHKASPQMVVVMREIATHAERQNATKSHSAVQTARR